MENEIDTEYTLTEVPPLTHEQIRATRFQVDSLGIPKMVDRETYEHECKLHQDAIRRAEQAEGELRDVQNIFARVLGEQDFSESVRENVLRVENKIAQAEGELMEYQTRGEYEIGYVNGAAAALRRGGFRRAAGITEIYRLRDLFRRANAAKRKTKAECDAVRLDYERERWNCIELDANMTDLGGKLNAAIERAERAEADARALAEYATHKSNCVWWHLGDVCNCGLDELHTKYLDGAK